jgi:hypothetical protein
VPTAGKVVLVLGKWELDVINGITGVIRKGLPCLGGGDLHDLPALRRSP